MAQPTDSVEPSPRREAWEEEIFFRHRWGRHGDKAAEEHARLRPLWEAAATWWRGRWPLVGGMQGA